jgi:hypothetical protein
VFDDQAAHPPNPQYVEESLCYDLGVMEAHIRGILTGDSSRQPDEVVLLFKVV